MTVIFHPEEERMEIRIEGPLTIMEAAETRDRLAIALATAPGPIRVDLSEITEIDTAGLQLLLALAREPAGVALAGPSPAVADRADRLGLRAALGLVEGHHGS